VIGRLLLAALLIILVGCGDKEGSSDKESKKENRISEKVIPVRGDAIMFANLGEPTGLVYNITSDSASHSISGKISEGLIEYDKDLNVVGALAESWDVSDDQKEITFHLKKDVRWHDGKPFTAADVEFTYKFMIDDKTPTSYDADFRLVKDLQVIDEHTVKVSYDKVFAPSLLTWGMAIQPKHLLEGKDVTKSPLLREPVGTGPYKFHEWKSGESVTLIANDDYHGGRPYIDKLVFRVIPDTATTFLEHLNGAVDIMSLTPLQWTRQTDNNKKYTDQYDKHNYLYSGYSFIGYNNAKAPFNDKRVRQALSYATPKRDIVKGILFDLAIPATGPYKPGTIWHNPNVKKYDYDLEKAKALLAEAGWSDSDGDGILDKKGRKFTFELITNQGNNERTKVAETLQQSWKKLGIKVSIRVLEWATFLNEYIDKQKFDAVVLAWTITHDPDLTDVWHSSKCGGKKLNFICYKNAELDELLKKGVSVFDPEKRKVYYHKIQEILAEEQPYTFLYVPYALASISKRFQNVYVAPSGISHNQTEWWVKKEEQKYLQQ